MSRPESEVPPEGDLRILTIDGAPVSVEESETVLAGAVGNLIDRLTHGHVIDFIDVYYHQYHWPVFNLADSVICIGAVLLMIDLIKIY